MKSTHLLIADEDALYVKALVEYIVNSNCLKGISIYGATNFNELVSIKGEFNIAIVSKEAENLINYKCPDIKVLKTIYLVEDRTEDLQTSFFKYQSMINLENLLLSDLRGNQDTSTVIYSGSQKLIGIFSPSKHELSLPFSLCVCKMLTEQGKVLFIDLSEISILCALLPDVIFEDLSDAIYLMENQGERIDFNKYIIEFQDFFMFAPIKTPSQSVYITEAQWQAFLNIVNSLGFEYVVVFFGNLIQGFSGIATGLSKLILLQRVGDYYNLSDEVFLDFMEKISLKNICTGINLPMSASNLTRGGYRLDSLIEGKLLSYVKRELEGKIE